MAEIIRKPEADGGLTKQLLRNFQTENSGGRNYLRLKQKMERVTCKKTFIAMTELIKCISTLKKLQVFL